MYKNMKIMIVDDSISVRKIIRNELETGGYNVDEAEDGIIAIEKIRDGFIPDLITLDIEMPGLNGFETYRKLIELGYSDIPVIFVTANDNLADRNEGFQLGATDFIPKVFSRGKILKVTNEILLKGNRHRNLTALVVDDSGIARKVIVNTLEQVGVKTIEAENGIMGYDILSKKKSEIDILITDFIMPEMDGIEFCEKVRNDPELQDLPVLFLTVISEQSKLLEIFKAGGSDYLTKPFTKEEFLARCNVHLERVLLTRKLRETIASLQKANEEIKTVSVTDPLTGCYNRRYMIPELTNEIKRSMRYGHSISMILCDLDYFKMVNDQYGHQAGDRVLTGFVGCIKKNIRENIDWIARVGGEEFFIVLPNIEVSNAAILAERLRRAVSEMEITYNKDIRVTASFGVTGFKAGEFPDKVSIDTIIGAADRLLYIAKGEGRNRVEAGSAG